MNLAHKCLLNFFCKTFQHTLVFEDASWPFFFITHCRVDSLRVLRQSFCGKFTVFIGIFRWSQCSRCRSQWRRLTQGSTAGASLTKAGTTPTRRPAVRWAHCCHLSASRQTANGKMPHFDTPEICNKIRLHIMHIMLCLVIGWAVCLFWDMICEAW